MHLTNYAIQKRSDDFIRDEETGTKRYYSLALGHLQFLKIINTFLIKSHFNYKQVVKRARL